MPTIVSIQQGGTGANNAANARAALGVPPAASYDQANAAYQQANLAYTAANNRVLNTGDTLTGTLNVQNVIPTSSNTYNLGSSNARFKDLWLSNSTIYLGDSSISADAGKIIVPAIETSSGINLEFQIASAYGQANNAYSQANNAYAEANLKLNLTGGTITGNLVVSGNANANNLAVTNRIDSKTVSLSGTGLAVDASQGNILTNQVTGTQFNFLSGLYTATITGGGSVTSDYTLRLPANTGLNGQVLTSNGTGFTFWTDGGVGDAFNQANAAYGQANNAYIQANDAFTAANNSNLRSGGLISGTLNVTNDIIVGGNVYLQGNTTFINVATYQINDSLMYIAANNTLTDSIDIGFVGGKNTSGAFSHTGLARDATDGKYKLFDNLPDSGHVGNVIDFANSTIATLVANVEANTLTLGGNTVATQANLTLAHNQANNAYGQANAAFDAANNARVTVFANNGSSVTTQNINFVNTSSILVTVSNTAGNANITFTTTDVNANTRVLKAGDTMTGQLNISSGGLLVTGNVGIGITNPVSTLHVAGGIRVANTDARVTFVPSGGLANNLFCIDNNNGSMRFFREDFSAIGNGANGVLRMLITDGGNVGIANSNPQRTLVVGGVIESTTGGFRFPDGTTQTTAGGGAGVTLTDVQTITGTKTFSGAASAPFRLVATNASSAWDAVTFQATGEWGDGNNYGILGGDGTEGIMLRRPHVVWNGADHASADIRLGRSGGTSSGGWVNYGIKGSNVGFIGYENTNVLTFSGTGSRITSVNGSDAPIFYDSNNTSFFIDGNNTSNLFRLSSYTAPRYATSDWADAFRNTPTSSYAWHGDISAGGPAGTWWFYESMRHSNGSNFWGTQIAWGWEDNANRLLQRNIQANSFSGWVEYLNTSGRTFSGDLIMGSSLRAPIFFDSNNTAFYIDPNSESRQYRVRVGPYTGHVSSGNQTALEIFNTSGTGDGDVAAMSFHCGGHWGLHMHLRHDSFFGIGGWSAASWRWYVQTSTGNMTCAGTATASAFFYSSDRKLKKDIESLELENSLNIVKSLNPVKFTWKDTNKLDTGFIAQEVQEILPEAVEENVKLTDDGDMPYLTLKSSSIIAHLTKVVQHQQKQIDELKAAMAALNK